MIHSLILFYDAKIWYNIQNIFVLTQMWHFQAPRVGHDEYVCLHNQFFLNLAQKNKHG